MSTYDARLAALEKEVVGMKQDIIYKLDNTNNAVAMILGIVGTQGRDLKYLIHQVKGLDIHLEGLTQDVSVIQQQQLVQGRDIGDIKHRLEGLDQRLDGVDQRLDGLDQRLGQVDQRFDGLDQRFDSIDQRFAQVLQALASLTNKAEQ